MQDAKKFLSREDILAVDDRPFEDVKIPEWGGWVRVNTMSAQLGAQYTNQISRLQDDYHLACIVVFTVTDEHGKPLFTPEDIKALAEKSKNAVQRAARVALRLNRFSASDIEEMAENFPNPQSDASGSG